MRLAHKGEYAMRVHWLSLVLLLALAVASCVPSAPETKSLPLNTQEVPSEQPSPTSKTSNENPIQLMSTPESTQMPSTPPPAEKFVSLAKKDLAERLKIAVDEINLVNTTEMTWPNASLGCPSPGKVYAQGRVPGYQIRLETGGLEYVYNTDLVGQVVLCPQYDPDNPASLIPSARTPQIGVPIK
jgi:hypothetical protein